MVFGARPFGSRGFGDSTTATIPEGTYITYVDSLVLLDSLLVLEGRTAEVQDTLGLVDASESHLFQIKLPSVIFPQHPGFYPGPDTFPNEDLYPGVFKDLHMGEITIVGDLPIIFEEGIPGQEDVGDIRLDQLSINFVAGIAGTTINGIPSIDPYVDNFKAVALSKGPKLYFGWDEPSGPTSLGGEVYPLGYVEGDAVMTDTNPTATARVQPLYFSPGPPVKPHLQLDNLNFSRSWTSNGVLQRGYGPTDMAPFWSQFSEGNPNNALQDFSLAVWVKPTAMVTGELYTLFHASNYGPALTLFNNSLIVSWNYNNSQQWSEAYVPLAFELDRWHFFAVTLHRDSALTEPRTGIVKMWHDGILRAERTVAANWWNITVNFLFTWVMGSKPGFEDSYVGEYGPIAFWNRQLTNGEVADMHLAALGVRPERELHTIRAASRRARTDHILMLSNTQDVEDDLMFSFYDLEGPVDDSTIEHSTTQRFGNSIYLGERQATGPIRRIDRVGNSFSWDWDGVADDPGENHTFRGHARMDNGWVNYLSSPSGHYMRTYDVNDLVSGSTVTVLPNNMHYTDFQPDANALVRVNEDNFVLARGTTVGGAGPEALSLLWDGDEFVVRSQISFGNKTPTGGHFYRDAPFMQLERVDDGRLIAIWRDPRYFNLIEPPWDEVNRTNTFYAQVIHLRDDGVLIPGSPPAVLVGSITNSVTVRWNPANKVLLVVGVEVQDSPPGQFVARTFGLVDDSIVEIDTHKPLMDATISGGFMEYALMEVDGEYAVLWRSGTSHLEMLRFKVGRTDRDSGAIQILSADRLLDGSPGDDLLSFPDAGTPLSSTEYGVLLQYQSNGYTTTSYKYAVATKVGT